MVIPFMPPLPMNHPFNTNVPQSTVSATVPVNPTPAPTTWTTVRTPKSVITPMVIPFVLPLPMNHPFNTNVPQSAVSATVPVNSTPASTRSLFPSAPSTPHTPATPHTPHLPHGSSPVPQMPDSSCSSFNLHASPAPFPSPHSIPPSLGSTPMDFSPGKKKKGKAVFQGGTLPSIAEEYENLGSFTVKTLKAMAKKEQVKAHIPTNIKKDKLDSILQNHLAHTSIAV